MQTTNVDNTISFLQDLSSPIDLSEESAAIILAAGHGKRIRSQTSKMLHKIWGKPTVERVSLAARKGLGSTNQVIVVGIKAAEVAATLGQSEQRAFAFQQEQNGTGDAVQAALQVLPEFAGDIFIFPGDMGLLTAELVQRFRQSFTQGGADMMVLTGIYNGNPNDNYYGRIVRVPQKDAEGSDSGDDLDKVIEIKEHKDILNLDLDEPYDVIFRRKTYRFSREELLNLNEFNTGVFAFRASKLRKHISELGTDNVQKELYVTDLISIFNSHGLTVKAYETDDTRSVLGFNTKSVLREMELYARERVYERVKDHVMIEDLDDFYIADDVVDWIEAQKTPLDLCVGKGVYIGQGVALNRDLKIERNVRLEGNVLFGESVRIDANAFLSANGESKIRIGSGSEIGRGAIIQGAVELGNGCHIDPGVSIVGSAARPTKIGDRVAIRGASHIIDSELDDGLVIEYSTLEAKHIKRIEGENGAPQPIRHIRPAEHGLAAITSRT